MRPTVVDSQLFRGLVVLPTASLEAGAKRLDKDIRCFLVFVVICFLDDLLADSTQTTADHLMIRRPVF